MRHTVAVPAQEMRPRSGCCLLQHVVLAQGKIAKKNAQLRAPRPTLRVLAGIPSTSRRKNREEKRANGGPKAHAERERERERERVLAGIPSLEGRGCERHGRYEHRCTLYSSRL